MKRFYEKILMVFVLVVLAFLNFSCEKEPYIDLDKEYSHEIFNSNFLSIYGNWELKDSWFLDPFDLLIIYKIGKFKLIKNEEILSEGKILIDKQTDTSLSIFFYSGTYISIGGPREVIMKGNDSLYLYCGYDCDNYFLLRK